MTEERHLTLPESKRRTAYFVHIVISCCSESLEFNAEDGTSSGQNAETPLTFSYACFHKVHLFLQLLAFKEDSQTCIDFAARRQSRTLQRTPMYRTRPFSVGLFTARGITSWRRGVLSGPRGAGVT